MSEQHEQNTALSPFRIITALIVAGLGALLLLFVFIVWVVTDWHGFVVFTHIAIPVLLYALGSFIVLFLMRGYLLPILERLWGLLERMLLFGPKRWQQAVLLDKEHAVVNRAHAPYVEVSAVSSLTVHQNVREPERELLALPSPREARLLSASDLLESLIALARTNAQLVYHDEKQWLLGVDATTGELTASYFMDELCNTMIGGQPRQGKSMLLTWLAMNVIASGGSFILLDPHASHQRRGLLYRLLALKRYFAEEPIEATDGQSIYQQFVRLRTLYERREEHGVPMEGELPLILVLIDEYAELLSKITNRQRRRECETTIANIIKGGNKYGMLMFLANHNWQVEYIGGAAVRDNLIGGISFSSSPNQYKMVLSTEDHTAVTSPQLTKGIAAVKRSGPPLSRVQFPYVSEEDIARFARDIAAIFPGAHHSPSSIWTQQRGPIQQHASRPLRNVVSTTLPSLHEYHTYSEPEEAATQTMPTTDLPRYDNLQQRAMQQHSDAEQQYSNAHTTARAFVQQEEEQGEEKGAEDGTGTIRGELRTKKGRRVITELSDAKKQRVLTKAEELFREYGCVPRKLLQSRASIHGDEYAAFVRFCTEALDYPQRIKDDISPEVWEAIKKKYDYTCLACDKREPDIVLQKDHVLPIAMGGRHEPANIQPLCEFCNNSKGQEHIDYRPLWEMQHEEAEEATS